MTRWCQLCLVLVLTWARVAAADELAPPPLPADATLTVGTSPTWPMRIDALQIEGLWRTHPTVVARELPWRPGDTVTADQWALGLARLWNTGLFSQVRPEFAQQNGQMRLTLRLEERWTLNPLFSFQVLVRRDAKPGESSSWWSLGASDLNVGGRFVEVAARYEQFNQYPGGQVFVRDHRFLGRRMDALLQFDWLVQPRPGFADRRMLLRGEVNHLILDDTVRVGARLDWRIDRMDEPVDTLPRLPPDAQSGLLDVGVRMGRVDVQRLQQVGRSLEVRAGTGYSQRDGQPSLVHLQAWLQALAFAAPTDRLNLAVRVQAGAMTQAPAQLQYFIGGLYEVRGVRDSYLRADRFALVNAEVRYTLWDSMWLAVVPAAFVDAALAHDVQGDTAVTKALVATGGGVRLLVPRFVRTGLRLDVAVPLTRTVGPDGGVTARTPGLSVGVFQYF